MTQRSPGGARPHPDANTRPCPRSREGGFVPAKGMAGTRAVPHARCVSLAGTPCGAPVPHPSPSAAVPALAQGDRVTRCPHRAIPALNNSWHCWPQASCPEEEEWLRRGRQSERENHHRPWHVLRAVPPPARQPICPRDPGPAAPRWGDGGPEDPAWNPLDAPCHSPKWGHGRPRWDCEHLGPPSQVTCDSIIGKTTFIGVT